MTLTLSNTLVIELHEREARVFPRSSLYDLSGNSLLLPEARALSAIDLRDVESGVELRVLGVIGYLPITNNLVLHLKPKFPLENLWKMLEFADEKYERILPVLRVYEKSEGIAPHQFLLKAFCHYIRGLLTKGVAREYDQKSYRGYFKPKVNFGKTISHYLSRGDEVNTESSVFTFTNNTYINGVLKSACLAFLKITPLSLKWRVERNLILDILNSLDMVTIRGMQQGDQEKIFSLPMWLRDDYQGALTVYSIFIGHAKVCFSYGEIGSLMPSFLFSMDFIFESYIRNFIKKSLFNYNISVHDGNESKHQEKLFKDNRRFIIKPDIIFKRNKKIIAIGEVKYKPKINEGDRYQLISHVVASGAPVGFWISPAIDDSVGLEYVGEMSTGVKLYHYKININSDIYSASELMVNEIITIIDSDAR